MPVRVSPDDALAKWKTGMSGAADRMKAGAMRVTDSPPAKAAAAADKWIQRTVASKQKFINNLKNLTVDDWRTPYINVGISRAAQGAQEKSGKMASHLASFLPYMQQGLNQIDKMPTNTVEDGIAKSAAMIRWNSKYPGRNG